MSELEETALYAVVPVCQLNVGGKRLRDCEMLCGYCMDIIENEGDIPISRVLPC